MPKLINDKLKIQALCHLRKDVFFCFGFIEIHWIKGQETYASWQIVDENNNTIGGHSQRFFQGEEPLTNNKIIEMVINNIEKFRINRNPIFSDVKVSESELLGC